jgi:alginate O-acetyltransferase complex protein AlgI
VLACIGQPLVDVSFSDVHIARSYALWQRWHISLSSFLRQYLYIPLGGNRKGTARTYLNLFIVMTLGHPR